LLIRVPDRDRLRAHLDAAGIGTEDYYPFRSICSSALPISTTPPARSRCRSGGARVAGAAIYPELSEAQQAAVVNDNSDLFIADNTRMELLKKIEGQAGEAGCHWPRLRRPAVGVEFARAGFGVIGYDVDERKVAELMAGRSYIPTWRQSTSREVVKN
jgi:hypothetical protein